MDDDRILLELRDFLHRDPSFLGRLIATAGLWNHATGRYDLNLPERFQGERIDHAVAWWHKSFFSEWLALSLEEKEADLTAYWESLGCRLDQINRIRASAEAAIPPLTNPTQRQDCIHDLMLITAMLRYKASNKETGRS